MSALVGDAPHFAAQSVLRSSPGRTSLYARATHASRPFGAAQKKGRLLGALHLVPSRGARDHRRPSTPVSKHGQAAKFVGDGDVAVEGRFVRNPGGELGSRA
jgi:hypothetical protein